LANACLTDGGGGGDGDVKKSERLCKGLKLGHQRFLGKLWSLFRIQLWILKIAFNIFRSTFDLNDWIRFRFDGLVIPHISSPRLKLRIPFLDF
jgi:hypothetical protein